jgi:CP family cyanate transporter-like MFS transporter
MPVGRDAVIGDPWWRRLRLTLGSGGPWRVALAFLLYSSQWLAVIGFLPSIYAQSGLGGQMAGTMTALVCLANITGNIGAGHLLHRGAPAHRLLYVGFMPPWPSAPSSPSATQPAKCRPCAMPPC